MWEQDAGAEKHARKRLNRSRCQLAGGMLRRCYARPANQCWLVLQMTDQHEGVYLC
jgi:hypothetical protein